MIVNTTFNNEYHMLKKSIESIIEYCSNAFEKIKSSLKSKYRFEVLNKVNEHLKKIFSVLFKYKDIFQNELNCFVQVKPYIIYIIGKNCDNPNFGHVNSALYLLDLFKSLLDFKFDCMNNECAFKEYETLANKFPKELFEFREYFTDHIFEANHEFDEEIEIFDAKLRGI